MTVEYAIYKKVQTLFPGILPEYEQAAYEGLQTEPAPVVIAAPVGADGVAAPMPPTAPPKGQTPPQLAKTAAAAKTAATGGSAGK